MNFLDPISGIANSCVPSSYSIYSFNKTRGWTRCASFGSLEGALSAAHQRYRFPRPAQVRDDNVEYCQIELRSKAHPSVIKTFI